MPIVIRPPIAPITYGLFQYSRADSDEARAIL